MHYPVDITVPVTRDTPVWPGDPRPELTTILSIENGDGCRLSQLNFGLHTGTHVDAPLHFINGGKDVAALESWKMEGEVLLVDATGVEIITSQFLSGIDLDGVTRVLFKTFSDEVPRNIAAVQLPYRALDLSAAGYLAEKNMVFCAIDGMTIAIENQLAEVHCVLLEKEIIIVENLHLSGLTAGLYDIHVAPMLIPGAEAAPARVSIKKSLHR